MARPISRMSGWSRCFTLTRYSRVLSVRSQYASPSSVSGIGISANKVPGIRAATCANHFEARYARLHNDINILCMGARVIAPEFAYELCDLFLNTAFEGGRHQNRVNMIAELERKY